MAARRTTTATALALLALMGSGAAAADAAPARVKGNRVLDGSGHELKVRGVVWGGDRFVPEVPGGPVRLDVTDAAAAFRQIQRMGGNLVRVNVSSALQTAAGRTALVRLRRQARARGLILLLANVPSSREDQTPWLRELARWFPRDEGVWYLPATDPECGPLIRTSACGDTETWIWTQTRYVRALRGAGVRTPIVLNLPDGSQSVALNWVRAVADRNVVYGVHPPAATGRFGDADAAVLRTSLRAASRHVPVVFDDVTRLRPLEHARHAPDDAAAPRSARTSADAVRWSSGLLDWLTGWTLLDGGDGAIVNGLGTRSKDRLGRGTRFTGWGKTAASGYFAVGFRAASGRDPGSGFAGGYELGDRGPGVRRLQQQLQRLGYLGGRWVNGSYDQATWHAVAGFQGYQSMRRDGSAGAMTLARLLQAQRPVPRDVAGGAHVEVDLTRQVLLLVNARGRVERVVQVSTGATGNTPAGRFSVERKERMSWSKPFKSWLPYASYFHEGIAFHQYDDVPTYPASHGCVRVPFSDAPVVFAFTDYKMPVHVYKS